MTRLRWIGIVLLAVAAPALADPASLPRVVLANGATGADYVAGGGGGGGSTSVTATAAAPTYTEGSTTNPLSTDLAGNLRTVLGGALPGFAATPTFNLGAPSPDATATGNLTAANQAVTLTGLNGQASILVQLAGTFVGSAVVEYSKDSFATVKTGSYIALTTGVTSSATTPLTAPGFYRFLGIAGYPQARVRVSAYTSGTIAATLTTSAAADGVVVVSAIPQAFQETANGSAGVPVQQAASTAKNLIVGGAVADGNAPQTYSEPVAGSDAAGLKRTLATDATGALVPPQAPSSAITQTVTSVSASTSTTIATALTTTIAVEIQCDGTAPIAIDRKGATLTSLAAAPLVLPATAYQLYVMPIATTSAITAWTATAQVCRVTQYARQ